MHTSDFARSLLVEELEKRQIKNSRYSMRAFARDLKISPSNLSEFLSGKRFFSQKNSEKVALNLGCSKEDIEQFILSSQINQNYKRDDEKSVSSFFQFLSCWYYFAVLNLAKLEENQSNTRWLSKRLAITEAQAKEALSILIKMGLITIADGKMIRSSQYNLYKYTKIPKQILKRHHSSILSQAGLSLVKDPLQLREMRSIIIKINPTKISQAKDILLTYREKITSFLEPSEIGIPYILSYHLYPMKKQNVFEPITG